VVAFLSSGTGRGFSLSARHCPKLRNAARRPWCKACGQLGEGFSCSAGKLFLESIREFVDVDGRMLAPTSFNFSTTGMAVGRGSHWTLANRDGPLSIVEAIRKKWKRKRAKAASRRKAGSGGGGGSDGI